MRLSALLLCTLFGSALPGLCLGAQEDLPAADAQTTEEKLGLGPTKLYVHWTGKAKDFRFFRRNGGYYIAEEFSFTFDTDGNGTWPLISREPTPVETYRFGTTFTGLAVDWASHPKVRVVAVKTIDRIPQTFQDYPLNPERILTALIVEVWKDGRWKPWYLNNWFHKWGTPADAAMILSHFVGRPSPAYDVYGFHGDVMADPNERTKKLLEQFPNKKIYHGRVDWDKNAKYGWSLDILHLLQKSAATGGYESVHGDPKTLFPLSRQAPAKE